MKNLIWIILTSLFVTIGFANNPIEESTNYTVVAGSGLKLRTSPNLQSSVIKVIPFGDEVKELVDTMNVNDRIEWMEGSWLKISHGGDEGYVFDGFLSSLPMPYHDFEYSKEDLMLIPPVDSWISYRYDIVEEPSVHESNEWIKVITPLSGGHKKIELETPYMYKMSIQLNDTKISEVYHLLKTMLNTRYEIASFEQKSVFIEDKYGDITRIKIELEEPIEIKKIGEGNIELNITSFHEGCKL